MKRSLVLGILVVVALLVVAGLVAGGDSSSVGDGLIEHIELFKTDGARWIERQDAKHRPHGRPLSAKELALFAPYFSDEILERARVRVVPQFENPEFYRVFDEAKEPYPIDLRRASGLALLDTILISERAARTPYTSLLFHELVHVVQYDLLGIDEYMRQYVDGWADSGSYRGIPLERHAYELARRFAAAPKSAFSVEEAVRAALGASEN